VQRGGRIAHLTPKEFKLLLLLMQHAGEVLNRRTIMKEVWETITWATPVLSTCISAGCARSWKMTLAGPNILLLCVAPVIAFPR